ncbi:MAG: ATP-binding protein [Lachnospiraceae bacterium]|nr:ATP-binding protein [Lachnospiraceae bacterium]
MAKEIKNAAKTPTYQSAYHGEQSSNPLTRLLQKIVERADKRKAPRNTLDTLPFEQIYPDGLCKVSGNYYTRMVQFYDINYQLAQNDEKQHIFGEYCQFLNYFDESIHFQFCFINQRVDMEEYKEIISIPDQDDAFNVVRKEYADYLRSQLEKGNNGIIKSKYLIFGIEARDKKNAVSRLSKIESDILNKFKILGCRCNTINGLERLRILHDYLNQDSLEKFAMHSFKDVAKSGLTPKNFISPTSFDFRAKDYYKIGDMFATTNYLIISAPEISDEMLAGILNMEDALNVTMHIDTMNQTEAMKYIKGKLSDINKMKIEEQKKAIRAGYDMDIIPPDIETYSEEAHGLLKEMQSRNERLFKVTFLITSFNENLQKMKDFRFTLSNNIQSANCVLRKLDHQQEQGFASSLPLGKNFIKQNRFLTTSSTAVFVPFTTQELFMESKESLYMGLNSLSNGMIMADRKLLKNPNGLILGTPGSGKSFATKREILNTFLVTTDDILICDPEAEYYPLVNYLGGQIIKIGQSSKQYINPLDINLNYSDDDDPVSLKADFILSFMELVVGGKAGLKAEEKSAIDFAVSRIYQRYFENPVPENMPILQDLYEELKRQDDVVSRHIAQCMYLYVEGSNNLFNHRTNVDLNNRIVCFDIKSLGKTLKKLGMLVVQDAVWNRVTVNREQHKYTRFYIDEFHLLLKDELTAAYSMEIWKRFRKWGGIPTGITQNVKDFLASKEIENIFDNSDFVYMLNQGADDRDILAQKLDISQHQIKYVTNVGQGEGLIFFGDIVQPFVDRFPKDTVMYTLLTTKPGETKTETEVKAESMDDGTS